MQIICRWRDDIFLGETLITAHENYRREIVSKMVDRSRNTDDERFWLHFLSLSSLLLSLSLSLCLPYLDFYYSGAVRLVFCRWGKGWEARKETKARERLSVIASRGRKKCARNRKKRTPVRPLRFGPGARACSPVRFIKLPTKLRTCKFAIPN